MNETYWMSSRRNPHSWNEGLQLLAARVLEAFIHFRGFPKLHELRSQGSCRTVQFVCSLSTRGKNYARTAAIPDH
jgi:hypothetical protein